MYFQNMIFMKFRYYGAFLLLSFFMLTSCRKKEEGFEMTYKRQFDLPVGLDIFASHNFKFNDVACDTSIFFTINNATASQIKRVLPRSMSLRSIFTSATRYDFIKQVEVYVSDNSRPKVTPRIAFFRDDVPLGTGDRLDLIPNEVDLRPFLLEGNRFSIRINISLRDYPPRTIETECNFSFFAVTDE
jgi:hypothetical protein